ncbi:MAG: VOC family protein [Cytophagia bacterium]|nr:VOC family protein [Cytophagia bacterium]
MNELKGNFIDTNGSRHCYSFNFEKNHLPLKLSKVHHIAIICSNYSKSKKFYTKILGLEIIREVYREERDSYKLDLALNGEYIIELFSFPNPPTRPSRPEAQGLRHLAFEVQDIVAAVAELKVKGVETEPIRTDEYTGKMFTFFSDPDDLPLEIYEL